VRFRLIAVGKPRDRELAGAIAGYERRAARYWPLEIREVREESRGRDARAVRAREGERLLASAAASYVVAVDETGERMPSVRFADWLQGRREAAVDVALMIGGANGLDAAVLQAADFRLSLAPWTLPHELARLVLAEQLYRAGTILRREPYHR
jgi:23S rRNA (pseudouridine1915-N3)-methyltransferase